MGKMMSAIMNKIINDVLAEVLLVMSCIYFTVAISEFLGLCGPLAVFLLNFVMDYSAISKGRSINSL
jgi:NhaP-type Na+/H+ and K+/H+ antiporter